MIVLIIQVNWIYQTARVKEDHLNKVAKLDDIISGYPTNWLTDYVSAEIQTKCNGKIKSAKGPNQILTAEQKNILRNTDLNSALEIKVKYRAKNSATAEMAIREMVFGVTVVPDIEAEYNGGQFASMIGEERKLLEMAFEIEAADKFITLNKKLIK